MSYFLFDGRLEEGQQACLSGEEARHLIHSRRVKKGEFIELQDQSKQHFQVVLQEVERHRLTFQVKNKLPVRAPSSLSLEILVGLPKEKSLNWIIQKVTELGAERLLVFTAHLSARSITKRQEEKTLERWRKIAQEACKQCGRQIPPEILLFSNLKELLSSLEIVSQQWVLSAESHAKSGTSLDRFKQASSCSLQHRILVGPEGGLHDEELSLACALGMKEIQLGPRILRTETAVVAMTSILQFLYGDIGEVK
ncbi:MAG: 16S rRNA (uracil(1498)-N(3))-methyltransferase [SAR324 cluster bacterium]|nr:16S rRNA (uracil(1498)-N(3))-methyltransferase [SAR324 cluster bacterium]